jgi:hypothetical protein
MPQPLRVDVLDSRNIFFQELFQARRHSLIESYERDDEFRFATHGLYVLGSLGP